MNSTARGRDTAAAAALYVALAIVFTWPLVRDLANSLPADVGDPLLNSWILAWDATHLTGGWRAWWNATVFYPHPLALAYSEHLAAQAVQILPVYWLTSNAILCYNLLFLSTFVLSGIGMFLLVRELTGDRSAAIVAGLAYAFAPYRAGAIPHLQVLSSAWMPFALVGFRRYFATRRLAPLAGGAAAWLLQNLSCGYYLLFFAPVMAVYVAWEIATRRLWRDARALVPVAIAGVVVSAATLPFLLPYLELRRLGFNPRSLLETQQLSADVYAYFTADSSLRAWGRIARAWPKAEGSLFPGITVTFLALAAALKGCATNEKATAEGAESAEQNISLRFPRSLRLLSLGALAAGVVIALLLGISIRLPGLKITDLGRTLATIAIAGIGLLVFSRDLRLRFSVWLQSPAGFFSILTLFAIVMSFGPAIHAQGRIVLDTSLYGLFYQLVPGFDGLRVPARFGMIVALGLSTLAGIALSGACVAANRERKEKSLCGLCVPVLKVATGLLIAAESFAAPVPINLEPVTYVRAGLARLPPFTRQAPPVYASVAMLPNDAVLIELPLGEPVFDVRYMFRSIGHGKRLINGYSGSRPLEYEQLDELLQDAPTRPERAWTALKNSGATHAVVHENFYADGRGPATSAWLRANGAREIASYGNDRVFVMP